MSFQQLSEWQCLRTLRGALLVLFLRCWLSHLHYKLCEPNLSLWDDMCLWMSFWHFCWFFLFALPKLHLSLWRLHFIRDLLKLCNWLFGSIKRNLFNLPWYYLRQWYFKTVPEMFALTAKLPHLFISNIMLTVHNWILPLQFHLHFQSSVSRLYLFLHRFFASSMLSMHFSLQHLPQLDLLFFLYFWLFAQRQLFGILPIELLSFGKFMLHMRISLPVLQQQRSLPFLQHFEWVQRAYGRQLHLHSLLIMSFRKLHFLSIKLKSMRQMRFALSHLHQFYLLSLLLLGHSHKRQLQIPLPKHLLCKYLQH